MKNNRFVAIILTFCILFVYLSFSVYASEDTEKVAPVVEVYMPGEYISTESFMYRGLYTVVGRNFDAYVRIKGIENIKEFVFEIDYNENVISLAQFSLVYNSDNLNYKPMYEQVSKWDDDLLKLRIYDDRGIADTGKFAVGFRFKAEEKGNLDFSIRVHSLIDGEGNEYEPEIQINLPGKTYYSTEIPRVLPDFDISLSHGFSDYVKTELAYRMKAEEFISKMKNAENCKTEITDADGRVLEGEDYIPTGAKLSVTFDNMPVFSSTFVLIGDVTRDAKINAADARLVLRFAAGLEPYKGDTVLEYAANAAGNTSDITAADAREILKSAAGIGKSYNDWYEYHCVLEKNDKYLLNDNLANV